MGLRTKIGQRSTSYLVQAKSSPPPCSCECHKASRRSAHTYTEPRRQATPLRFAPKIVDSLDGSGRKLPLALFLKNTSSILKPEWAHLSPAIGAALTTTPLINNLLRMAPSLHERNSLENDLANSSRLASSLFFQIIRESEIFPTRTKSVPSAYLNPQLIAGFISHSMFLSSEKVLKEYLKEELGIKSNKIHGDQWTGISLARWVDLLRFSTRNSTVPIDWLALGVWLVALWESSQSKRSWLDYLLECDRVVKTHSKSDEGIFQNDNSLAQALQQQDPDAIADWSSQRFDLDELSATNVQFEIDRIIYYISEATKLSASHHSFFPPEFNRSLELVCSAVALRHTNYLQGEKPAVPNGYHNFDGGWYTADCVEVTVREIMDLLLWDEGTGTFDLTRLPDSTHPELLTFYRKLQPSASNGASVSKKEISSTLAGKLVGKEWFDLLSDLPGCDYFMEGNTGKRYELIPTMENVSKVCGRLLLAQENPSTSPSQASEWTTLDDLAAAWSPISSLMVQQKTLYHQISSERKAKHEIATFQIPQSPHCIEIRMRCELEDSSGFSAVTHLRHPHQVMDANQVERFRKISASSENYRDDPLVQLLSVLFASECFSFDDTLHGALLDDSITNKRHSYFTKIDLLSTAFACDRRRIMLDNEQGQSEEENTMARELFDSKELLKSQAVLRNAMLSACYLEKENPESSEILLQWLLRETPKLSDFADSVVDGSNLSYDKVLETNLLSLSPEFWSNEVVEEAMFSNASGLLRGRILSAHACLMSGKSTPLKLVFSDQLSMGELISLFQIEWAR